MKKCKHGLVKITEYVCKKCVLENMDDLQRTVESILKRIEELEKQESKK